MTVGPSDSGRVLARTPVAPLGTTSGALAVTGAAWAGALIATALASTGGARAVLHAQETAPPSLAMWA